jgi:hypothetical protein
MDAKELALGLPKRAWRTVSWREGSNERLSSRFARVQLQVRCAKTYDAASMSRQRLARFRSTRKSSSISPTRTNLVSEVLRIAYGERVAGILMILGPLMRVVGTTERGVAWVTDAASSRTSKRL